MTTDATTEEAGVAHNLSTIVDALGHENELLVGDRVACRGRHSLPSRVALAEVIELLRGALFPSHFGAGDLSSASSRFYIGATLDKALRTLLEQVHRGLAFDNSNVEPCEKRAAAITQAFASQLPEIRRTLALDIEAAYAGDPSAPGLDEAIFCYPGINALIYHRIAHALFGLGVPLLPRIISEFAHSLTGIDIHPGAQIGQSFFIDHGTGVVIGETTIIGRNVRLYQGVTLGARSFPVDEEGLLIKGIERHPMVEDDVVIYAGATILGRITIGRGSSIGGNVWLTRSVPPGSIVTQAQSRSELFQDGGGI